MALWETIAKDPDVSKDAFRRIKTSGDLKGELEGLIRTSVKLQEEHVKKGNESRAAFWVGIQTAAEALICGVYGVGLYNRIIESIEKEKGEKGDE